MNPAYAAVMDANVNRVAEGLRVIEEYTRFIAGKKTLTDRLAVLRKHLNQVPYPWESLLAIRDTAQDMRAKEIPQTRSDLVGLLKANFKRVEEGLRVLEEYSGNPVYNQARYDVYDLEKEVLLGLVQKNIRPGIYLISDSVDVLQQGLAWGVSVIQLRDKHASKAEILEKARAVAALDRGDIPLIINDFIDIALLVNADGVHTGQDDLAIGFQRQLLGPHRIIGRTTHSLDQGLQAQAEGADYISVGPIWETPSKPGRAGIGFDYLADASAHLTVPYVAIGGVNRGNIEAVLAHNPPMVGLIRDFEAIPELQRKMNARFA
ncbi:MAG: thiamine phosphate synthase [Candidatus Margulisiibacteriota bacterium]